MIASAGAQQRESVKATRFARTLVDCARAPELAPGLNGALRSAAAVPPLDYRELVLELERLTVTRSLIACLNVLLAALSFDTI